MKFSLAKLEARLQALIEGGAARLFPAYARGADLPARLLEAMRAGAHDSGDGGQDAPNLYILSVHPSQVDALQDDPGLIENLTTALREAGEAEHLRFPQPPVLRIVPDPLVTPEEFRVEALHSQESLTQTNGLQVEPGGEPGEASAIPANAFLIVDGARIFPLEQPVINIGRRPDNELVIDDPRVSRVHAQLRAVKGRFLVFDLDSTGGTFVNGEPVRQGPLYAGDVISLAGVPLVFGQDSASLGETQDFIPPEGGLNPPGHSPQG